VFWSFWGRRWSRGAGTGYAGAFLVVEMWATTGADETGNENVSRCTDEEGNYREGGGGVGREMESGEGEWRRTTER
jgi:hypothetical protein